MQTPTQHARPRAAAAAAAAAAAVAVAVAVAVAAVVSAVVGAGEEVAGAAVWLLQAPALPPSRTTTPSLACPDSEVLVHRAAGSRTGRRVSGV